MPPLYIGLANLVIHKDCYVDFSVNWWLSVEMGVSMKIINDSSGRLGIVDFS